MPHTCIYNSLFFFSKRNFLLMTEPEAFPSVTIMCKPLVGVAACVGKWIIDRIIVLFPTFLSTAESILINQIQIMSCGHKNWVVLRQNVINQAIAAGPEQSITTKDTPNRSLLISKLRQSWLVCFRSLLFTFPNFWPSMNVSARPNRLMSSKLFSYLNRIPAHLRLFTFTQTHKCTKSSIRIGKRITLTCSVAMN